MLMPLGRIISHALPYRIKDQCLELPYATHLVSSRPLLNLILDFPKAVQYSIGPLGSLNTHALSGRQGKAPAAAAATGTGTGGFNVMPQKGGREARMDTPPLLLLLPHHELML
ncbi:hypothetical protein ONS96_014942 [Cadophora gregata f. sp. sojae]|nr:hypothetical protein ONS96_014942 [Cadophora gregata f. sp. sojae]